MEEDIYHGEGSGDEKANRIEEEAIRNNRNNSVMTQRKSRAGRRQSGSDDRGIRGL